MSKATGRFRTRCGAILDIQTAVAVQDRMENPDEMFSLVLVSYAEGYSASGPFPLHFGF